MGEYILRLFIMLPLVGGMAWGSLWLWRKLQLGMPGGNKAERAARITEVLPLGAQGKLAVVEFGHRQLLISVTRGQVTLIASHEPGDFHA